MDRTVEMCAGGHKLSWNHAISDNCHPPVDIVQECFKGFDALSNATLQYIPLIGGNDAWDNIQGKRPLLPRVVERHATVQEGSGHGIGPGGDIRQGKLAESPGNLTIGSSGNVALGKHLVIGTAARGGLGVILE